jgi:hypothetical protein
MRPHGTCTAALLFAPATAQQEYASKTTLQDGSTALDITAPDITALDITAPDAAALGHLTSWHHCMSPDLMSSLMQHTDVICLTAPDISFLHHVAAESNRRHRAARSTKQDLGVIASCRGILIA